MRTEETAIALHEMALFFSYAADIVSPALNNHHLRVAGVAVRLAREMSLPEKQQENILLAALLHDIGALSIKERMELLRFEDRFDSVDPHLHGEIGYLLFSGFGPLSEVVDIIRNHHRWWDSALGGEAGDEACLNGASVVHLADRVDVLLKGRAATGEIIARLRSAIAAQRGRMFAPRAVDAFMEIASGRFFGEEYSGGEYFLEYCRNNRPVEISLEHSLDAAEIFCHVIDFRSRFTATHSSGVAAVVWVMAGIAGFNYEDRLKMKIAGYLHDLGKLSVPAEIIDKPGPLLEDESRIIRTHPNVTFQALDRIRGFQDIRDWASHHHERPDGRGYPFGLEGGGFSRGARIVAVSDVFVALTEDRPYRGRLSRVDAVKTLKSMATDRALDTNGVSMLMDHIDDVDNLRARAQADALAGYLEFERKVRGLKKSEACPRCST